MTLILKQLIITLAANLGKMLLTRAVILWALRLYAKQTTNLIDDNVINLVEAGYDNDSVALMKAVDAIVAEYRKLHPTKG